jgi:hypothetical protein
MKINNPFIKDPKNVEFLENNWEAFLDYMSKHHSLADCWHTILDLSTFTDAYVSKIIASITAADHAKVRAEKARIAKLPADKSKKPSTIDKKNDVISEAVEAKQTAQNDSSELFD